MLTMPSIGSILSAMPKTQGNIVRLTSLKLQGYSLAILILVIFSLSSSQSILVEAQEAKIEPDPIMIETIFAAMTPNERVGQLFMVSFRGSEVGSGSAVAELIQRYRVGGIYISAQNENFNNNKDTPRQV